jgi:hypothetical protein
MAGLCKLLYNCDTVHLIPVLFPSSLEGRNTVAVHIRAGSPYEPEKDKGRADDGDIC